MKKLIKDWWPLLLIAGWWLWKKTRRKPDTASIADELVNRGFTKIDAKCPVCGSDMYQRYSFSPTDLTEGIFSANLTETCSNPKCVQCEYPQWA